MGNRPLRLLGVIAALMLLSAACGDDSGTETGDLPVNTGDTGDDVSTEPACLPDEPDCEDTSVVPDEGEDLGTVDDGTVSSGMTVDGGLTIEEALTRSPADGIIAVKGLFYRDDTGVFLCGLLAESLPPQCGGAVLALEGPAEDTIDVPIESAQGVQWTNETVSLFGTVSDGVLTVDPLVTG